jgi:hypothetical protein
VRAFQVSEWLRGLGSRLQPCVPLALRPGGQREPHRYSSLCTLWLLLAWLQTSLHVLAKQLDGQRAVDSADEKYQRAKA